MNLNLKELIERVKVWAQKDAIKNIWADKTGRSVPVQTETTFKYSLPCCSACFISANDETSILEISYQVERLRVESLLPWNYKTRCSGEKLIMITVGPQENILRENLKQLNFSLLKTFERRTGYPKTGKIELWTYEV